MPNPAEPQHSVTARWVLPPIAAAIVLAVIGALGMAAHDAWLVPNLGAAVLVQLMTPKEASARTWPTLAGQFIGIPAGFIGVYVAGVQSIPSFLSGHPLEFGRVLATCVAIVVTMLTQRLLKAISPAGGAVALLLALGATPPTAHSAALLAIGIVLVTLLGEPARFLILRLDNAQAEAKAKSEAH